MGFKLLVCYLLNIVCFKMLKYDEYMDGWWLL